MKILRIRAVALWGWWTSKPRTNTRAYYKALYLDSKQNPDKYKKEWR